ncbi:MAG: pyridoxal phosphate-dependent aminotransferase family protein [Cyclobacteriaceae bacterium]
MDDSFLKAKLDERSNAGNLRRLPETRKLEDFVSNDYLGLAGSKELFRRIHERVGEEAPMLNGGTGSRLLSGNHHFYHELEEQLRDIFKAQSALAFNSGYAANQALVASVASKGDTIIYDQLSHVCLKEGAWLSQAQTVVFRHNDLDDLKMKIQQASGRVFVVTETIFSMDGDIAPLEEIIEICNEFGAFLIVDEAHSTGVVGPKGAGLLVEHDWHHEVFARVYTFGKAMGVHGACIAGSQRLKEFLINFGRPFIYTTSLPPHSVISIEESFKFLANHIDLQIRLKEKIKIFRSLFPDSSSETAVQPIMMGSNEKAKGVSDGLLENGFDVRPILSPTVRRGTERLRVCLHVFNSEDVLKSLIVSFNNLY